MTDKNTMKEELRAYIVSEFLPGESTANVKDDTALRTSGVLDSMGLLRLVSYIEERYGIELEAHETGIDNFDNIEAISNLIQRKVSERA